MTPIDSVDPFGTVRLARAPAFKPVFFDDGVVLDSNSPATALYGSVAWPLYIGENTDGLGTGGTLRSRQVVLRFTRAVSRVSMIVIPFTNLAMSLEALDDGEEPPSYYVIGNQISQVFATLLKVPLRTGDTYDIEGLTWNAANVRPAWWSAGSHGTLFQTAANFEAPSDDLTIGARLLYKNAGWPETGGCVDIKVTMSDPDPWGGGDLCTGAYFCRCYPDYDFGQSGPYYGLHLRWYHAAGTFAGNDNQYVKVSTAAGVREVDPATPAHRRRPFVLTDGAEYAYRE